MQEAISNPDGTAARLRVGWVRAAVKTGTAGDRRSGYDAIVLGYLPAGSPRVAFGLIAEDAGLAGVEGIRILQRFLNEWRRDGPDILGVTRGEYREVVITSRGGDGTATVSLGMEGSRR
jgi:hypothetical protein